MYEREQGRLKWGSFRPYIGFMWYNGDVLIEWTLNQNWCPQVYRGYVDDPRNTDNSWMETVAVNFHDDTGEQVGRLQLHAGKYQTCQNIHV